MIFNKMIGLSLIWWSKIPCGSPTISEIKVKTSWPARTATSSKDRWTGDYSFGITNLGNSAVQLRRRRSRHFGSIIDR